MNFTAIDFETANYKRYSACAMGLVRVENGRIVGKHSFLIRPPERHFKFTYIHGISWVDVERAPTFKELWPEIEPLITAGNFLAAHNAPFDRSVLEQTCRFYGINCPEVDFKCTCKISRGMLGIRPAGLANVCRVLGIPLNHHEALSDAVACARILLHVCASNPAGLW